MKYDLTALYLTFCLAVRSLTEQFNVSVISWWRSKKHNADLKGHPESFHLEGLAADLEPDDPADLAPMTTEARALGLQVSPGARTLHVELDYRNPRAPQPALR